MSSLGIPVDIKKSEIASNLNGMILQAFLMGMYTIIYSGTIYLYFAKDASQRRLVPAAVTMLYMSNLVGFGIQWYNTKWEFINNGDTRNSVFTALYVVPTWFYVAEDAPAYIAFVLADGLLIWRCFFVWNRSLRIILVPLLLITTEAALLLVQIVFDALYGEFVSQALSITLNDLLCAAFFITFATTLVTTILIAYRIHSVSKQEGVSPRRFKHIIDIVVQSGAVNSLVLLANAIIVVLPGSILDAQIIATNTYAENLVPYLAAMSTTIMVARVALLTSDTTFPSTISARLSGLQFHAQSTHQTNTERVPDMAYAFDVNRISAGEGKRIEGDIQ